MSSLDWSRVAFTEHMTEAAAVVGECHVVLAFPPTVSVTYAVKVFAALKGGADAPYFAVGVNTEDAGAYRPVGSGPTAEDALQDCLATAGVHHRRLVKQGSV